MNVVIYQNLIILIFVMFYGIRSAHVSISGNVTDFLGSNKTKLKCSFDVQALVLNFFAKNKTGHVQTIISIAVGSNVTFPSGEYLKTRVDVTQLKLTSRNLSVTFNELRCEDDQEYACEVKYFDSQLLSNKSYYSSIYVRAPPLKPSSISLVKTPEDSIISSTKHMEYSNSPPSTTVTSTLTESESLKTTIQKDTTAFNYSAVSLPDYDNTSSTPSDEDFSNNTSYRNTTYSTQQATKAQDIAAGDNITIVCTGNVGKPAAKHVFKKYLKGQIVPMQDTVTTTSISELSENCSYYRTSNLTFQVTAADNNVVIRCVVDSSMAGTDMFIETKPIEVYYDVPTTQSSSTCSSSCVEKKEGKSKGNFGVAVGSAVAVFIVIFFIIVIVAYKRNTPPELAVYALVNEATKLKNKQKTETINSVGKQEEDTYAETQEGIYDKAGDRRHKEKENDEHYDSSNNSSKQNSNGDNKLSAQTSQVGSYANQGFEKDENRKVATVSPTVRSSSGSQNDEQTNSNRTSQSTKGYGNIIGTEQTGISEEGASQQTAL